ncbi:MAG: hypothetical protein GC189_12370 [Alphaproteobacteria bacterium]|nr:hypothetical protein [Alphaproteobacteria bacterium]
MMRVFGRPVVQLAIHAPDIEAAARESAASMGWGPFFVARDIRLKRCLHRGAPRSFVHSSAYGQGGDIMIEWISQPDDAPSVLRDAYDAGQTGLHHAAIIVDDLDAFLAEAAQKGCPTALDAETDFGLRFAMADARAAIGLFVEAYERGPILDGLYNSVRAAAQGWDGADPVREMTALRT